MNYAYSTNLRSKIPAILRQIFRIRSSRYFKIFTFTTIFGGPPKGVLRHRRVPGNSGGMH